MLYRAGRKGKCSVCGLTVADWIRHWHVGEFQFRFSLFLFSNKYFLIIIYIKHVPNRLFCWMFFSVCYTTQWFISLFTPPPPFFAASLSHVLLMQQSFTLLCFVQLVCSQTPEYQEPVPFGCRRRAIVITVAACSPAMLFVVLITSVGALPPLLRS